MLVAALLITSLLIAALIVLGALVVAVLLTGIRIVHGLMMVGEHMFGYQSGERYASTHEERVAEDLP